MPKVLIDAGHGGKDTGAQAADAIEKDISLKITMGIGDILEHQNPGIEVYYTRIADEPKSLFIRYKAIMDIHPDAFVSIHCNAIEDNIFTPHDERESVEGLEIFYRDKNDLPLAHALIRILSRTELWRKMRGIKKDQEWLGKKLTVLNSLEVPAVLIEIGFISHERERIMILNNTYAIAELIAHGIIDYLGNKENQENIKSA